MVAGANPLDEIANDLALWIDQTATEIALAFAPRRAPFSAKITEEQKLEFYKNQLFNPDGSPNAAGRAQQLQRLGTDGFAQVYQAVLKAHPELRPPPQPEIAVPEEWPGTGRPSAPGGPPGTAGPMSPLPGGPGMPPGGMPMPPRGTGFGPPPPIPSPPPMMPPGVRPMAQGGVVTRPTLALIGEAGPEAVVPLPDYQPPAVQPQDAMARLGSGFDPNQPAPISPWDDLIRQHLPEQHQDLASDPRFIRTVAAGARAESSDDPRAYQLGYDPNNPRTWNTYGGRGLWQFDINKGAKGYGIPEEQLLDPNYQASVIVPEYAAAYRRALAANPNLSDEQLAAQVYGATEYPAGTVGGRWQAAAVTDPRGAYANYMRAYNALAQPQGR